MSVEGLNGKLISYNMRWMLGYTSNIAFFALKEVYGSLLKFKAASQRPFKSLHL